MDRKILIILKVLLLCIAYQASGALFAADWPMFRHDPQRTAVSPGSATIIEPTVTWRYFLGGAITGEAIEAADVNGDGRTEILLASGGRLMAKYPDDSLLWRTPLLNLQRIERAGDFDDDGQVEVVASATGGGLFILGGEDGAVLWEVPAGTFTHIGAVRWADFDGDGLEDIYVADAACGSVGARDLAIAYSFASGVDHPTYLFSLEQEVRDYVCGINDAIGDFDGDGAFEVLTLGFTHAYLFGTRDGSLESISEDLGPISYGLTTTVVADVDGDGADDLLGFMNNTFGPGLSSRRVFLLAWDSGGLVKRWEYGVSDPDRDQHSFVSNPVGDLDGDGILEIATSFFTAANEAYTTYILDTITGNVRTSLPGARIAGITDVDGDGNAEVLTDDGNNPPGLLSCHDFIGGTLFRRWSTPSLQLVNALDRAAATRQSATTRPVTIDLNNDGIGEILTYLLDAQGSVIEVRALDAVEAPPSVYGSYTIGSGRSPLSVQPLDDLTEPGHQVALVRSDGYLIIFNHLFESVNEPTEFRTGLRIGGFYSGYGVTGGVPVAADIGGGPGWVVIVPDSRGSLVGLDPRGASMAVPPSKIWEREREAYPTIIDQDGNGTKEILMGVYKPGESRVRLVEGNGENIIWDVPVGGSGQILSLDVIPENISGDGTQGFLYNLLDSNSGNALVGLIDSTNGSWLWPSPYTTLVAGSGHWGDSFWDVTDDGIPDPVLCSKSDVEILNGSTGSYIMGANAGYCVMPALLDINSDSTMEIISVGSVGAPRAFDLSLNELWRDDSGRSFYTLLGGFSNCPSATLFIEPPVYSPLLVFWNAATGDVLREVVLAGGTAYATVDAAIADGKRPGFLGNVTAIRDFGGEGGPGALVGSTDGYLYAIDPCAGNVLWAYDFQSPVGEAIFADIDADDKDEIIVTAADGYLYSVDELAFPAPEWVYDTDPPRGITNEDVDTIVTIDTLYATWAPVPETVRYEYAVVTAAGVFLTDPEFIDVGTATSVESSGLSLQLDGKYYFAVRAVGSQATSVETLSDGVTVIRPMEPEDNGEGDADVLLEGQDGLDAAMEDDLNSLIWVKGGCGCSVTGW